VTVPFKPELTPWLAEWIGKTQADATRVAPKTPQLPPIPTIGPANAPAQPGVQAALEGYSDPMRPVVQGLQAAQTAAEFLPSPFGDVASAGAAVREARAGNPGMAALSAAGALPLIPSLAPAARAAKKGKKALPKLQAAAFRAEDGRIFTGPAHPVAAIEAEDAGAVLTGKLDDEGFIHPEKGYISRREAKRMGYFAKAEKDVPQTVQLADETPIVDELPDDIDAQVAAIAAKHSPPPLAAPRKAAKLIGKDANEDVLAIAERMIRNDPMPRVTKVDPDKAAHMAKVYEGLPKMDPEAKSAYDLLNDEVAAQAKAIEDAGYRFEFVDSDPYENSAAMMKDVRENKRLKVFKTPRPLYHGTNADFERFNPVSESANDMGVLGNVKTTRHGAFFTDNPDFAKQYGKVGEYTPDISSTAEITDDIRDRFLATLDPHGPERDLWLQAKYGTKKPWTLFEGDLGARFTRFLKDEGYDSARFVEDVGEDANNVMGNTTVVFDPDKIKRAAFHPYMTPEQNDRFRAVHDWIAHAGPGNQFGPIGEENAYRMHAATLSPQAQRALASETRGQNSWVNFGPHKDRPMKERPFAEQKAALWPEEFLGDYDAMPAGEPEKIVAAAQPQLEAPQLKVGSEKPALDESNLKIVPDYVTDPMERAPLYRAPRAELSQLTPMWKRVKDVFAKNADQGLKEGLGKWYDVTPLRDAFKDVSETGQDDLPQGYATRRQASVNRGVRRILEEGNLNPFEQPKTFRYGNIPTGRYFHSVPLDMHVGRQTGRKGNLVGEDGSLTPGRGFPAPSYAKDKKVTTSPTKTSYAPIEDHILAEAEKRGVPGAPFMAAGWEKGGMPDAIGGSTGVADIRGLIPLFNERIALTAQKRGVSRAEALKGFMEGKWPLAAIGGLGASKGLLSEELSGAHSDDSM
jgi:hypothetical protein